MYSHLLNEEAFDHLIRAHNAVRTLYFLLDNFSRHDSGGQLEASGLSAMAEHILNDLRDSLEGCEEVRKIADIYTPPLME